MLARRRERALVWGALGTMGAIGLIACSLDWTERPDAADGSAPTSRDGEGDRAAPQDATGDRTAPPVDAETGPDCAALIAELEDPRNSARRCTFQIGECTETVKDACDCDVVVARTDSAETAAYLARVATLKASGCSLNCAACPSTSPRSCLSKATGSIECFPP